MVDGGIRSSLIVGGHRGLSLSIFEVFASNGLNPTLLTKGEWDANEPNSLDQHFTEKKYDYIVVCAHLGYNLGSVLEKVISLTDDRSSILVIGSMVSNSDREFYYPYQLEKLNYDATVRQFQRQHKDRIISIFRPGLIDTDLVATKNGVKMNPDVVAHILLDAINIMLMRNINILSINFTGK